MTLFASQTPLLHNGVCEDPPCISHSIKPSPGHGCQGQHQRYETKLGVQANVLDCGRFGGEKGFNDNADGFAFIVQRRGAGVGQVGGRSAKTEEPKRMDRRFGMRMGVMEGGLFSAIKKLKKENSGLGLYSMALMLLSMGSSMGTRRLLLC